jgi:methylmalonyl-CoA mutase N-terminal domain/subunit
MAGSYVVEKLTDEIEARAVAYIQKIDDLGGALASIEKGYMQGEIQDAAYRYQQALEKNEEIIVGLNAFQIDEKIELERLSVDPSIEKNQIARLVELRNSRDPQKTAELLCRLEVVAKTSENLMPLLIECVEKDITLGEICGVLRQVWGEYQPASWI